jgi:hypothetical protein
MPSPVRLVLVAAFAIACHGATAQTVVPASVQVQRVAPQLVAFAGSLSNFQNLVTGLAQGTPVQLVTLLPDGSSQVVTFTPTAAMPPAQVAQVLETARQQLIGLGIANPTAEQIAVTLMGGIVPTAIGGTQLTGVLNTQNPPSPAAQAQANAAAGAGATSTTPASATTSTINPPVNVQIFPGTANAAATPSAAIRTNTSDSLVPAGATSRSPSSPTSTTPGPAGATTPPPGERASSLAGAPTSVTATPAASATPAATPQPGNANSALRAR